MKTAKNVKKEIVIGEGWLSWPRGERQTDRYGTVGLETEDGEDQVPMPKKLPLGKIGELQAEVLETRGIGHIGDLFRGFQPSIPKVGAHIMLGKGGLFVDYQDWDGKRYHYVGLKPEDGRETDWLNPKALYKVHNQKVRLVFVQG